MSGHSKWSTIKRAKGVKDAARGKLFSKLGKAISIAAKSGGDPDANPRLRMAVEQARAVNMPKENIERAILKGSKQDVELLEIVYEGFGPGGFGIIVEVATDNKNRTASEISSIFKKGGGNLAGPGAVAFNFDPRGVIVVEKNEKPEEQLLTLIDLGVEDVEEGVDAVEVYVTPSEIGEVKNRIDSKGFKIKSVDLVRKPKTYIFLEENESAKEALKLLESLEEHEDVQKVYANLDIPEDLTN